MEPHEFNVRRSFVTGLLVLLAIGAYVIGYRVTEINPAKLLSSLPKGEKILSSLIRPDLFTRETTDTTIEIVFPVPCGSAQPTVEFRGWSTDCCQPLLRQPR